MRNVPASFIMIICIMAGNIVHAQLANQFNLAQLYKDNKLTVFNRDITVDDNKKSIELSQESGEGLVWINSVSFSTGTIELDLRGQDIFQHSFLGIAFHGVDDSTFEAIYFRPFQFRTNDPVRRSHGVQYISLPVYTWQKLRAESNGIYEKEVKPELDPDEWFHTKIVVKANEVWVYVNNDTVPILQAPLLSKIKKGRIALYTADQSGGAFANLVINDN